MDSIKIEEIEEWIKNNPRILMKDGSGSGDGSGYCSGYGSGVKEINHNRIFMVDDVQTIITNLKSYIAKGFTLNNDLTLSKCYIVKGEGFFAHGKNLHEAEKSLEEKIDDEMPHEEKIEKFKQTFNNVDAYLGSDFFKWHHILTGSCLFGRNEFVKNNGLDVNAKYTVKEFLKLVENQYGWKNVEELVKYYK